MISAEEMRNLVSSSSTKLSELESKMKDRAQKDGKFYLEMPIQSLSHFIAQMTCLLLRRTNTL